MSPFSHFLHELRMRRGVRQAELAEMTGYEQSYISALEVGLKGPPTEEFVEKLIEAFDLPPDQAREVRAVADASERKLVLDKDCPPDLYWMLKDMREHLRHLHPRHIKMIRDVLELAGEVPARQPELPRRLPRRRQEEAPM
jgi:transcriptional regulator with XRE-family HTH domain